MGTTLGNVTRNINLNKYLRSLYAFVPSLKRASDHALSVYMPVRAEGFDARFYDIEFGKLKRRYKDRLADEPAGLLELVRLPAETESRLQVGPLLLAPIERQLERFPPALIAVVDKERAKLFAAILDDVHPIAELEGQDVKHTKAGGTSAASNQRKADNRTKANLELVVQRIQRQMQSGLYERLFVAGPEEARTELEHLLPEPLRQRLAGHLSVSLDSRTLQHELREQLQPV